MSALFDKLGGQQGVEKVVTEFYKRVMADSTLNHFFANTDMAKQHAQQVAFFAQIFDGPKVYNGRSMDKTHTGMNLQPQHFDAVSKHLRDSLTAWSFRRGHKRCSRSRCQAARRYLEQVMSNALIFDR